MLVIDRLDARAVLSPQDDVFVAIEQLERASYVVVVDNTGVPVGSVTSYDTGQIFSEMGEVLVRAKDMEERLRQYIKRAFPNAEARRYAPHGRSI
jgi:hypothetical protein